VLLVTAVRAEVLPDYKPVPANLEVIITRKGKPTPGVPVEFEVNAGRREKTYWNGVSDASGKLLPRRLAPGKYRVYAHSGTRDAELYLEVAPGSDKTRRATLEMKLTNPRIGDVEDAPVSAQITDFEGTVLDPLGDALADSPIEVLRRNDVDAGSVLKIQSDSSGHFAAHLNNGTYIAVIYHSGFKSSVVVFQVTGQGKDQLKVILQIGGVA
jgi:hypothetical protein